MVNFAMEVVIQRANIPVGKSFDSVSAAGNYRRATLEIQKWCSPQRDPNQKFPTFIPPSNASASSPFAPISFEYVPIKIPILILNNSCQGIYRRKLCNKLY